MRLRHGPYERVAAVTFLVALVLQIGSTFVDPDWGHFMTFGWISVIAGGPSWYANPILLYSLIVLQRKERVTYSLVLAIVAFALAAFYHVGDHVFLDMDMVPFGWAYGLWLSSTVVAIVGNLLIRRFR